ncbi:MAG: hypothetical protein L0H79_15010 [Intrasporangium sp.]|uniref:hypothetical protein n=1 Tax=Intrasporangium sp. TaxID=1925024 RepID=UPI00264786BF|nr:hypothetical protein [Intrasporangium sp.]MDN5797050.1 hypothetical protein [Intrasporangium sp.]
MRILPSCQDRSYWTPNPEEKGHLSPIIGWGAAAAFVAFLTSEGLPVLKERAKAQDEVDTTVRNTTAGALDDGRSLATSGSVADLGKLGVHPATRQVPYQPRDIESEAQQVLADGHALLVLGESMAGKSRMCAHIIQGAYPNHRLMNPLPEKLPELLAATRIEGVVVWLDDLERYLNVAGLRPDWVDVLLDGQNIVVATMRSRAHDAFMPTGEVRHPQLPALRRFQAKRLKDTADETARLAAAMPDPAAAAGVARYGLGAYIGGGPYAVERFEDARTSHPLGQAMVRAAVDWRRIGLEAISTTTLAKLAPAYLNSRHHDGSESTRDALNWARARVFEVVQLLESGAEPDSVRATDYMLDHLSAEKEPIPDLVWETATGTPLPAADALTLAMGAYRANRPQIAAALWKRVAGSGHADQAPVAAFNLGVLEQEQGEVAAARAAYQLAIDSGHADQAPRAAFNLGILDRSRAV